MVRGSRRKLRRREAGWEATGGGAVGLNESEPDSVHTTGEPAGKRRSLRRKPRTRDCTKHVKAGTLVVVGMVGAGRRGREHVEDERAVGNRTVFMTAGSEEPTDSSQSTHSSDETGNDRGAKECRKEKP